MGKWVAALEYGWVRMARVVCVRSPWQGWRRWSKDKDVDNACGWPFEAILEVACMTSTVPIGVDQVRHFT